MSASVAVASVTCNTKAHIARLLFSLHRTVAPEIESVIIVDNGSTDGSGPMLESVASAGLCSLISNSENRHHGPGLDQAVRYAQAALPAVRYLWVLDSDCVVLDADVVRELVAMARDTGAALIGESAFNRWHDEPRFGNFSLFLDLELLASASLLRFDDDGDPSSSMQAGCVRAGLTLVDFAFSGSMRLIHVGRGTLQGVVERGETRHPLFDWAVDHNDPHFQQVDGAAERYERFCAAFDAAVPNLTAAELIQACQPA